MTSYQDIDRAVQEQTPIESIEVTPIITPAPPRVQRITDTSDRITFARFNFPASAIPEPRLIVPYHRDRLRVTLIGYDQETPPTGEVFIGGPSVTLTHGFPILRSSYLSLETRGEIWGITEPLFEGIVFYMVETRQHDEV